MEWYLLFKFVYPLLFSINVLLISKVADKKLFIYRISRTRLYVSRISLFQNIKNIFFCSKVNTLFYLDYNNNKKLKFEKLLIKCRNFIFV